MSAQQQQLEHLAQEINAAIPNPWLFPTRGKVQGFLGTGPIMFVGERPSTGNFGGPADHLLYSLLEKFGAADAHMTDVIKRRGLVNAPYPDDIAPHRRIFDKEIEIVRPRRIVAFGQKVYDLLQFSLAGSEIKITQVWHYSKARWGITAAATFEKQMQEALDGVR